MRDDERDDYFASSCLLFTCFVVVAACVACLAYSDDLPNVFRVLYQLVAGS